MQNQYNPLENLNKLELMGNLKVGISWAGLTPLFKDLQNGCLEQATAAFGT
jgi:hypothetical protein